MKYLNCFVKYSIKEEHTIFIQIPEKCMNSLHISDIHNAIRKKIADRYCNNDEYPEILEVKILSQFDF